MKSILVIGMGKFGIHLAKKFVTLGNDVVIIDNDPVVIGALEGDFADAQIGDCTNENVIKSLGVDEFDICIVAIGDDFQSSLVVTSHLKKYGAKYIVSKATQDIQAQLLKTIGANEIVYPEKDVAESLAVRFNAENVFDFVPLTDEFALVEIPILWNWVGKTIVQTNVRKLYNINIIAIKKGANIFMPTPSYKFSKGDHIVVFGYADDAFKLSKEAKN